jgi:sugar lactone lactonase YvrE
MRRMRRSVLITLMTLALPVVAGESSAQARLGSGSQEARKAIAEGDGATAIRVTDSLLAWYPDYPNVSLMRARALMIGARPDEAERALRRLLGWDPRYARYALTDSILKPLAPRLIEVSVAQLAAAADAGLSKGTVWATIDERDLIPEGTAYDPATQSVLIGSLNKNKILAIDPDGTVSERVASGSNGLGSVVGIHVDSARGILWVASNRRYDTPADSSKSALFGFDSRSGQFRSKIETPVSEMGFFNDLTTDRAGNVYLTDTQGGHVWMLKAGASRLEQFQGAGRVDAPNGITVSADGRHLFVADLDHIQVVDLAGNSTWRVAVPDSINVAGIDGLAFHAGTLIAHHPLSFWRIARYQLDPTFRRIVGRTFIERSTADGRTSTTGEVAGDGYVYLGNTQIDRMNSRTIDAATMEPIRIYRAVLR